MNNFYCLYNSKTDSHSLDKRLEFIEKACQNHSVTFIPMDQAKVDFSNLPIPRANDGLYNCARGSRLLECTMINPMVRTLYREFPGTSVYRDTNQLNIVLEKFGIPTPKTIHCGTNDKKLLEKYVNHLEGFPIILKTFGGSGGVGTMQIDSFQGLFSIADYLVKTGTDFLLKQFIKSKSIDRYTAINEQVFAGICRLLQDDKDFRTDGINGDVVENNNPPIDIKNLVNKSVKLSNLYMAGVDLISEKKTGKNYILEVNLPANFYGESLHNKTPLYEKMIEFFINHPRYTGANKK